MPHLSRAPRARVIGTSWPTPGRRVPMTSERIPFACNQRGLAAKGSVSFSCSRRCRSRRARERVLSFSRARPGSHPLGGIRVSNFETRIRGSLVARSDWVHNPIATPTTIQRTGHTTTGREEHGERLRAIACDCFVSDDFRWTYGLELSRGLK